MIGIDPGAKGAIAFFENGKLINVLDMPTVMDKGKPRVDPACLVAVLQRFSGATATMERVGAMPGQGVSSMFQFGRAVGCLEGVLAALQMRVTLVAPTQWKGALRVPRDKGQARLRASQLIPEGAKWWPRAGHDGCAEAALIGCYGLRLDQQMIEW